LSGVAAPNVEPLKVCLHSCPFDQPVYNVLSSMNEPRTRLHAVPVVGTATADAAIGVRAGST